MEFLKNLGDQIGGAVQEQLGQLNLGGGGPCGRLNAIVHGEMHSHTHPGHDCSIKHPEEHTRNRYCSFVPESSGHAKWYVDGATYFWALSIAIEGRIT